MANYFQDPAANFIPTPLYQPNITGMEQALAMRQSRYDEGKSKLQGIYGSIFNQKMTNSINAQEKNKFLDGVDKQLSNLAAVDLSKQGNVQKSADVFSGYYKNDNFIDDIDVTTYNNAQIQTALKFKDSTDPKMREQYWDAGVQDVMNSMEKLRNGDPNDKSIYQKRTYVPYRDIEADIRTAYKDMGAKFQTISGADGPQLEVKINGMSNFQPIKMFVQGMMGTKYDDMFEVQGRNDYNTLYKNQKANNPYASDAEIKSSVANYYVANKVEQVTKNLNEFKTQMGKNQIKIDALFDKPGEDGKLLSPQLLPLYNSLKVHNEMLKADSDNAQNSLKKLELMGEDRVNIERHINEAGSDFFASLQKNNHANNIAVGIAVAESTDIKKNDAFFAEATLKATIDQNMAQRKYWDDQIEIQRFKAQNDANGVNGDGTSKAKKGGKEIVGRGTINDLNYHDKGFTENDPKFMESSYEGELNKRSRIYQDLRENQIEAVKSFLPYVLSADGVGLSDATAWAVQAKKIFNSENKDGKIPEGFNNGTQKSIEKYLTDKGVKFDPSKPETMLDGLISSFKTNVESYVNSNQPMPRELAENLTYNLDDLDNRFQNYNQRTKEFNKKVDGYINEKIKKDPVFASYVRKNADDNYEFVPKTEVLNYISGYINSAFNGKLSKLELGKVINGIKSEGLNVTTALKKYGNTYEDRMRKAPSQKTMYPNNEYNFIPLDDPTLLNFDKVITGYTKAEKEVNEKAATDFIDKKDNTFIGKSLDFPILAPTVNSDRGSDGYRLLPEALESANHETPEEGSSEYEKFESDIKLIKENMSKVSSVTYNTTGTIDIVMDWGENKEKREGTFRLKLAPNASGEVINKLPTLYKYNAYESILDGETWSSSKTQKDFGFDAEIIPNNAGDKGSKSDYVDVVIKTKRWDTSIKDANGEVVGGWLDGDENDYKRFSIPTKGDDAKSIDDIKKQVEQYWQAHFMGINKIRDQFSKMKTQDAWVPVTKGQLEKQ